MIQLGKKNFNSRPEMGRYIERQGGFSKLPRDEQEEILAWAIAGGGKSLRDWARSVVGPRDWDALTKTYVEAARKAAADKITPAVRTTPTSPQLGRRQQGPQPQPQQVKLDTPARAILNLDWSTLSDADIATLYTIADKSGIEHQRNAARNLINRNANAQSQSSAPMAVPSFVDMNPAQPTPVASDGASSASGPSTPVDIGGTPMSINWGGTLPPSVDRIRKMNRNERLQLNWNDLGGPEREYLAAIATFGMGRRDDPMSDRAVAQRIIQAAYPDATFDWDTLAQTKDRRKAYKAFESVLKQQTQTTDQQAQDQQGAQQQTDQQARLAQLGRPGRPRDTASQQPGSQAPTGGTPDMTPSQRIDLRAPRGKGGSVTAPGKGANWWDRMWSSYRGTIAGIPRALVADKLGVVLPEGTGNYKDDLATLRNIYTDADIDTFQTIAQDAFNLGLEMFNPVERADLSRGALGDRIPDFYRMIAQEVPAPTITTTLPPLPPMRGVSGPRLVTGELPPPATLGGVPIEPVREQRAADQLRAAQPAGQAGILGGEQPGILSGQPPAPEQPVQFGPFAQAPEPSVADRLRNVVQQGADLLGQAVGREPMATIEDVVEPDDMVSPGSPAQEAPGEVNVPTQDEQPFQSWMRANNVTDQLQQLYTDWASTQGFDQVPSFNDWLRTPMGTDYLSHYYDRFVASQYPTYPEGRTAYMRARQFEQDNPFFTERVPDIEEVLARSPARFPEAPPVQPLPEVGQFEEQLPPVPQGIMGEPFEPTQPTPQPLYPGGLAGTLQEARRGFQERTIPTIAERFGSVNALRSGAFAGALLEAGRQFETDLARLAEERRMQEEQFNLARALQEQRRVQEENRLRAQREELAGRHTIGLGQLAQQRAQTARQQQLAREQLVQQRGQTQQELGLRQAGLGGQLAQQAATTEQARVGLLGRLPLERQRAEAEIASRYGQLGLQGAQLQQQGQVAQAAAQLGRGRLLGAVGPEQQRLGLTQAQLAEQLRQGQVGQQLSQFGQLSGVPPAPNQPGNIGNALGGVGATGKLFGQLLKP